MNVKQIGVIAGAGIVVATIIGSTIFFSLQTPTQSTSTLNVTTSFYPLSYCAEAIGGDYVTVHTLVPANNDVHSWQPSPSDILTANRADLLLYNGAHLDSWFEDDILTTIQDSNKMIVDTTSNMLLLSVPSGVDPHTWVSPYMIQKQAQQIFNAFVDMDPSSYAYYHKRWNHLSDNLTRLDQQYLDTLNRTQENTIFVTHTAFGYLAHRYNFTQKGLIGLSADQQPSAVAVSNLIDLMTQYEIFVVYVDPIYSKDYAYTLKNTLEDRTGKDVSVLTLYTMLGPIDGLDYLHQIEHNLINLKIGLGASTW